MIATDFDAALVVRHLGLVEYAPTVEAMQTFTRTRDASTPDAIWLVEHPPVYTLGQAGRMQHVLGDNGIAIVQTDRGGQVTYHGPGQLVAYVLVDLKRRGYFVKEAVFRIEQAVIDVLAHYGLAAVRIPGAPGVYLADEDADPASLTLQHVRKIAALGLKVKDGLTYHGVALNVAMDLAPFASIDPCGYVGLRVTDMASSGVAATLPNVGERLAERLAQRLA